MEALKHHKSVYLRRRIQFKILQPLQSAHLPKKRKVKGPVERRDCLWWQHGYHNGTNEQFKRRLRVNRDTFDFILNAVEDPNFLFRFVCFAVDFAFLSLFSAIKSCWLSSSTLFVRRKCKKVVLILASNVNLTQFSVRDEISRPIFPSVQMEKQTDKFKTEDSSLTGFLSDEFSVGRRVFRPRRFSSLK